MLRKWWSDKGGASHRVEVRDETRRTSLNPEKNSTEKHLTLNEAVVERLYVVVSFEAGRNLQQKIFSMGLNFGAQLKILSNSGHGPVELQVRQTRLGIGRGMSRKIRVKEVER